jgi:hypothetical protein
MENFSFTVTESEANLIIASLAKQPFEVVASLIQKLQAQATKQNNERKTMSSIAEASQIG